MSTIPPTDPARVTPGMEASQPTVQLPQAAFGQQPQAEYGQPTAYSLQTGAAEYGGQYSYQQQIPTGTTVKDTNTYALVSILLTFLVPLAGIIFGHMGLSQIKRTGDAGRGLALTGLIFGYCIFALSLVLIIMYVGLIALAFSSFAEGMYYSS